MGYDDPYASGRAPTYTFFNAGMERSLTRDMTLQVNYVGNESHHAWDGGATNARGYWNNQLNPAYLAALGGVNGKNSTGGTVPLLTAPATTANIAILNANLPGQPNPVSFIAAANAFPTQSTVTIAQMLVAFPQYSSVQDGWGGAFEGNFSYNSLQITLSQREAHGLTFNINYTYSKNIGDDGTFRSGYPIPTGAIDGGGPGWKADRIDRSWTTVSIPEIINAYGVYKLPVGGKGQFGGNNWASRGLLGGWQLSWVYTYSAGTPVVVTWSAGGNCAQAAPNAGQCMPSLNPNFTGSSPCKRQLRQRAQRIQCLQYRYRYRLQGHQLCQSSSLPAAGEYIHERNPVSDRQCTAHRSLPAQKSGHGEPQRVDPPLLPLVSRGGLRLRGGLHQRLEQGHLRRPQRRLERRLGYVRPGYRHRRQRPARLAVRRPHQLLTLQRYPTTGRAEIHRSASFI